MSEVGFRPTHVVPAGGLDAWAGPDANQPAVARLDPGLDVELVRRWGDWAEVRCSNGWRAWVDGGALPDRAGPVPTQPPAGPPPTSVMPTAPAPPPSSPPGAPPGPGAGLLDGLSFSPALIGGVAAAAGAVLPWVRGGAASENAFGVPVKFLVDQETTAQGGFSIGWLVLAATIAGCAVLVRGGQERLRRIAGGVAAGLAVLYVIQVQRLVSSLGDQADIGMTDIVGLGVLVTLAGGAAMAVAPGSRP